MPKSFLILSFLWSDICIWSFISKHFPDFLELVTFADLYFLKANFNSDTGRLRVPKPRIFLKSSKRGVIFNPQTYIADFGPVYKAFSDVFRKTIISLKMSGDGEGSNAVWNFSENSSVLLPSPVPNWILQTIKTFFPHRSILLISDTWYSFFTAKL